MIGLLGINYKTAPIEVREKFVFNDNDIITFNNILKEHFIDGSFILFTCNRTEVYFEVNNKDYKNEIFQIVIKKLKEYKKIKFDIEPYFYQYSYHELINHLFNVASGLDSMALGEYQVVGQIKEALAFAEKNNTISSVLLRLVRKALEAGKTVRTNTNMNKGAVSVSYAAVQLAQKTVKSISKSNILLIGAGQNGELIVQNLIKKGAVNIFITNRTEIKARQLAKKYKGKTIDFNNINDELFKFDIILTSTGAKKPIIQREFVETAMDIRNEKPVSYIDLSVPRNVAEEVEKVNNVAVYDIDSLEAIVNKHYKNRKKEIEPAQKLLDKHITDFKRWLSARKLKPVISSITNNFNEINKIELDGFKHMNKDKAGEYFTIYGEHITNKFIRLLIKNVKEVTENGKRDELLKVLNDLFKLK